MEKDPLAPTPGIDWAEDVKQEERMKKIEDIQKLEKLNSLSINVYIVAEKLVNPFVISKERDQDPINLLLIEGEEKNHYCWIKNYDKLSSYDN